MKIWRRPNDETRGPCSQEKIKTRSSSLNRILKSNVALRSMAYTYIQNNITSIVGVTSVLEVDELKQLEIWERIVRRKLFDKNRVSGIWESTNYQIKEMSIIYKVF